MQDTGFILNELKVLRNEGVTNTNQVVREYQFTADNELDYTASIADTTTVTVSELPSNTISIIVYVRINDNAGDAYISFKRNTTDTQSFLLPYTAVGGGGATESASMLEIPTDANTFYVGNEHDTCQNFNIVGYKVSA
jgi:hypothetical protein